MQMYNKLISRNRLLVAVQHQMFQDLHQVEALHKLLILKVVNQLKSLSQILDVVLQQTDQDHLLVAAQHQMFQDLHQVEALHKLLILEVVNQLKSDKLQYHKYTTRKFPCLLKNSL